MSGHSKWSSIKHKKAATDARRGQLFTKLAKEITVATRDGGDPNANSRLRLAIQKAKASNMPGDNIERAIQRGAGGGDSDALREITYEGYGPGGTAFLVETVTDNRNRTVADVRKVLTQGGGNLAASGSVAWQFELRGIITVAIEDANPDEVQLAAIEAGADEVSAEASEMEALTSPAEMEAVRDALAAAGLRVVQAEIAQLPKNVVQLDESTAVQALRLLDQLDELDDVARVCSNADFPAEALAAVSAS